MNSSRLRAPFRVLEELLGEAPEDDSLDKSSTQFVYVHEGRTITVFDFHKPEWNGPPEALTDPAYVWTVDGDGEDVAPFCAWLSAQVLARVPPANAESYRWPLSGEPKPTPPRPPRPAPNAVAPRVRAKTAAPELPPLDAHRRRVLALQALLEARDDFELSELRTDLARLSEGGQRLAESLAREPELPEAELRTRLGAGFERACAELDALLKRLR